MIDGAGESDGVRQIAESLFVVVLRRRTVQEAAPQLERLVRFLDDHLTLEAAQLVTLGFARRRAVRDPGLQEEARHSGLPVIFDLGTP